MRGFVLSFSVSFFLPALIVLFSFHISHFYATRSSEEFRIVRSPFSFFFRRCNSPSSPSPLPLSFARGKRPFSYSSVSFFPRFVRVAFSTIRFPRKVQPSISSFDPLLSSPLFLETHIFRFSDVILDQPRPAVQSIFINKNVCRINVYWRT